MMEMGLVKGRTGPFFLLLNFASPIPVSSEPDFWLALLFELTRNRAGSLMEMGLVKGRIGLAKGRKRPHFTKAESGWQKAELMGSVLFCLLPARADNPTY
jgi:hypothetical protein